VEGEDMALIMGSSDHLLIFKTLFVVGSENYNKAKSLADAGVKFQNGLYKIIAVTEAAKKSNNFPEVVLPVGTSSLVKNEVADITAIATCRKLVAAWLDQLVGAQLNDIAKSVLKSALEPLAEDTHEEIAKKVFKSNPVDQIINLRDAKAINQKVKGSSQGSVYRCIAFNPRLAAATRIKSDGSISLRVECNNPTQEELAGLQEVGLKSGGTYFSMHLSAEGVSPRRIVGAFLLGMGIKFDEIVSGKDLIVEG